MHISFNALSDGSSEYTTDSVEVQEALERHYRFGSLFRLYKEEDESEATEEAPVETTSEEEGGLRKVSVSDFPSAKDYLAETFGISRTQLRSQKQILEQAAAHGIEFEGI